MPALIDFKAIKETVPIDTLVPWLQLKGQWKGDQWRGPCPHCKQGGDRALVVTKSKGAFYCFGVKKGGDAISLVSHIRDTSQSEAAKLIADAFMSSTPIPPSSSKPQAPGFDAEKYAANLDPEHAALEALGVSPPALREWRAGYASTGILRGRLALPVTRDGHTVAYIGRSMNDATPLLTFPNGFEPHDYIFGEGKVGEGTLQLVRDPLDVLKAHEGGLTNVVCFLTDEVTAMQLQILAALMDKHKCESVEIF